MICFAVGLKENVMWREKLKREGYDILDIGGDRYSTFYNMEKDPIWQGGNSKGGNVGSGVGTGGGSGSSVGKQSGGKVQQNQSQQPSQSQPQPQQPKQQNNE